MAQRKSGGKGLFDIFRDAVDAVEKIQKKQTDKNAGVSFPKPRNQINKGPSTRTIPRASTRTSTAKSPQKSGADILRDILDRDKRHESFDKKREQRQVSFDKYLDKMGNTRNPNVDQKNQEMIEAFIATHEERVEDMREKFNQDIQKAKVRFDNQLQKLTQRHRGQLEKMVNQANVGEQIKLRDNQLAGKLRGGSIKLPRRGRIVVRRR